MTSTPVVNTRRRLLGRIAVLAFAIAGVTSAGVWAHGAATNPHAISLSSMSPADLAEHVSRLLEHVYIEVGATPEQKAQLDPILRQACTDLMALHTQAHSGHDRAFALLTADHIDRAALETLRADHLRIADQASKRIVQLIGDVADVLTPEQRKMLADRIAQHHAWHMGWHNG